MIVTENIIINGKEFKKTYSDEGRYVVRDGVSYSEAVDPAGTDRQYEEGDYIPTEEDNELAEKAAAYDILMGVNE